MAAHKMNRLHWHLTDDQGWRIEIKAYPKLTSVGAWRGEGTQMPTAGWDKGREGHPGHARYGGFHTQADIREIVAHAKKLHIEIIPEIDVPGHASAITTAYPETLPIKDGDEGKSVHGLTGDVISVVREENYAMLETIFREIAGLFPAPYIHVGGDEVNVNSWNASPEHRAFMKEHGMGNAHQLQNHFMLRLEKILAGMGRTLVGWNEIMHGGQLSKDTVIMSWIGIGPGINAARKGHPVVMCPGPHCYFDMKYPGPNETGHWWAGVVSTERAYDWNPSFDDQLNETEQARIKGVQGCLWTEFVPNTANADYKYWPRACATAEVGWTPQERRDWSDFRERLGNHLARLDRLNVNYRVLPSSALLDKGTITLSAPGTGSRVVYTTDGSDPTATSMVYSGKPFSLDDPSALKHRALRGNGRLSKVVTGVERLPVAEWSPEMVSTELKPVRFKLEGGIDAPGIWHLGFHYKRGAHKIVIEDVQLLRNGKQLARDMHTGHAGGQHTDNVYRLVVPFHKTGDTYTVMAQIRSDGGNDSHGILTLEQSPYMEPEATATTSMPVHGDNTADRACDWNRSTIFWSSRNGRKGDTFTITFAESVSCKEVSIQTGKANSNKDIILDGTLALSPDGETFGKPVALVMGAGTIKKASGMRVKALRLTVDSDQDTWVIVRDPRIK
jgi:hexosaminidase